jgi:hypothetical protein
MHADLDKLAADWRWLIDPGQFTLVAVSPFGDLFMKEATGAHCLLDINAGELLYAKEPGVDPSTLFPIAFDMIIATEYVKAGMLPADGQCFGYKRQLVAGGSLDVENVYVATLDEYVSFMGDFHRQIQDIPDGTTVTIRVINQKVIQ